MHSSIDSLRICTGELSCSRRNCSKRVRSPISLKRRTQLSPHWRNGRAYPQVARAVQRRTGNNGLRRDAGGCACGQELPTLAGSEIGEPHQRGHLYFRCRGYKPLDRQDAARNRTQGFCLHARTRRRPAAACWRNGPRRSRLLVFFGAGSCLQCLVNMTAGELTVELHGLRWHAMWSVTTPNLGPKIAAHEIGA